MTDYVAAAAAAAGAWGPVLIVLIWESRAWRAALTRGIAVLERSTVRVTVSHPQVVDAT